MPSKTVTPSSSPRSLARRPQEEYEALQTIREKMQTDDGKALYALRAGIESAMALGVRRCGMRRSRYRLRKTALQHVATGAAMNLVRGSAWLDD